MDGLVKEAAEIRLTNNNCNTDVGFILSHAWSPITMFMNVKSRTIQSRYLTPPTYTLVSLPAMSQGCGQVYHDEGGLRRESVS